MSSRNIPVRKGVARRAERGRVRLAAKRRRARFLVAGASLFIVVGSVLGLGFLSHTERLAVSDIEVHGTEALSPDTLKAKTEGVIYDGKRHLFSRANIFLYPKQDISNALLETFPRIQEVSVSRTSLLASAVAVTVKEREPYAVWCQSGSCYALASNGFIFDGSVPATISGYVFSGGLDTTREIIGQTFLLGRFHDIQNVLDGLKSAGVTPVSMRVENESDYVINTREGFSIHASFAQNPSLLVQKIALLLSSEPLSGAWHTISYIDVRFEGRGYYKLKGE